MLQRCYKALLTHNGMCVGVFVCYCKGACGHEDGKKFFCTYRSLKFCIPSIIISLYLILTRIKGNYFNNFINC